MIIYYVDQKNNYLSSYNNNFYVHSMEDGDPIIKKYKAFIFNDGKFKKLKTYIGKNQEDKSFIQTVPYLVTGIYELTFLVDNNNNYLSTNEDEHLIL